MPSGTRLSETSSFMRTEGRALKDTAESSVACLLAPSLCRLPSARSAFRGLTVPMTRCLHLTSSTHYVNGTDLARTMAAALGASARCSRSPPVTNFWRVEVFERQPYPIAVAPDISGGDTPATLEASIVYYLQGPLDESAIRAICERPAVRPGDARSTRPGGRRADEQLTGPQEAKGSRKQAVVAQSSDGSPSLRQKAVSRKQ